MKTHLITGGAGFIGSHLAEVLLGAGHRVIVVDDLSTGRLDNVGHLRAGDRFECVVGSVLEEPVVEGLIARADTVFHLAAAVGVGLVTREPVRAIETNVRGTSVVLGLASKHGKPVLITSSSEVYGKGDRVPFREDEDIILGSTTTNRWSYGCTKALDEFLALAHRREDGLDVVIARLFNTTGPRQTGRYGMVVPRFVRQALAGEPITVYGDGKQSRCFCHVDDVVRALARLIDTPAAYGQVLNVGSDEEISIRELADRVRAACGSASAVELVPHADVWGEDFEDMQRRVPDLRRVRDLIGFRPSKTLDEILADVIEHERARLRLKNEMAANDRAPAGR